MAKQNASTPSAIESRIAKLLNEQDQLGLRRNPPTPSKRHGIHYELDGKPVVSFCSNDYLGLASEIETPTATTQAGGSGASPLVCGYQPELRCAEASLAKLVGCESTILLPSGYQANLAAIPTLLNTQDRVFSDVLNHGSLIDAIRLARPAETILQRHLHPPKPRRPPTHGIDWWITESTFSMDGDGPTAAQLREFLTTGGHVIIDCSHDIGIRDPISSLRAEFSSLIIQTFGLGKAPGIFGGAVAGQKSIVEWIRTNSRAYIFSTAISPAHATQIDHRISTLSSDEMDDKRVRLKTNTTRMRNHLEKLKQPPCDGVSPIIPIIVGDNHRAVELAAALLERGWHVQAIRPPTVPVGQSRLRTTISSLHTFAYIDDFADDLSSLLND